MKFVFEAEPAGRLLCVLQDADGVHHLSSADAGPARDDLLAALEDLEAAGSGECYWQDEACDYRWVFKREGGRVKLAVLRLTGVCPGYQHVAWMEDEAPRMLSGIRAALAGG